MTDCHIDISRFKFMPAKCFKRMKTIGGLKTAVRTFKLLSRTNTALACLTLHCICITSVNFGVLLFN